jgi:hypothetical protein
MAPYMKKSAKATLINIGSNREYLMYVRVVSADIVAKAILPIPF